MSDTIDFGDGVVGRWCSWKPDRSIESNRVRYDGIADVEHFGMSLEHLTPQGTPHEGFITFDTPAARLVSPGFPTWQVSSWEPLTCTPSVLCSCGWHGFITNGKWRSC